MPDSILVALDGSSAARNAADVAIQIAQKASLSIKGIFIVDEALVLDPYSEYHHELGQDAGSASREELIKMFEAKGSLILDQLRSGCDQSGVSVETELVFGGVPELLLDRAQDSLMLSAGRRGNEHASELQSLGKYFLHIAHLTHNPIIVGGELSRTVERLFLVYRGKARAEPSVDWTVRLQRSLDADVMVGIFNGDTQPGDHDEAHEFFNERGLKDYSIVDLQSKPISDLATALFESRADLILMHGYWHSEFFDRLFGSLNDEVLLQSQLPVLMA